MHSLPMFLRHLLHRQVEKRFPERARRLTTKPASLLLLSLGCFGLLSGAVSTPAAQAAGFKTQEGTGSDLNGTNYNYEIWQYDNHDYLLRVWREQNYPKTGSQLNVYNAWFETGGEAVNAFDCGFTARRLSARYCDPAQVRYPVATYPARLYPPGLLPITATPDSPLVLQQPIPVKPIPLSPVQPVMAQPIAP
jgi:hypothetical protein